MALVYVVVTGPPASGKSTLSRELAGGWPVVEVTTATPVDVAGVVRAVREAAR